MGFLEERNFENVPSIPEYFRGKNIFITGGSGFMGKVLVEKLLYSCSDLDKIYLLLRVKKGVEPLDRLKDLYSSQCFDRLREEKPEIFAKKVIVVPGDIMKVGLGLSDEFRQILINKVNVIFHVAASVRFDDPLTFAVQMNLQGTKEMIELAKEVKSLSIKSHSKEGTPLTQVFLNLTEELPHIVFVHVSTSYSNTNRATIEEVMYPAHAEWRDTLDICRQLPEHMLRILTPKYLGQLPNTYTFTKQLAEHVGYENRGQLPIVIFRPSIVISSVEEPMTGWIENFNGPVGLMVACGKGIMRSLYTDPDLKADYIPVDVSIKSMICAAWIRGTKKLEPTDDIEIYNCCSGNLNNITMGEMIEIGRELAPSVPLNDVLWNVGGSLTTSPTKHYIKVLLLHLLPALIVDSILWSLGRKPMLTKVQRRIYNANLALLYYITQQWTFSNVNFVALRSSIKEEDKKHFYYEIENVDKRKFFLNACLGAKKYLLKEDIEDMSEARTHLKRMYVLDKVVQCIFYGFLAWWILNLNVVQNFLNSFF